MALNLLKIINNLLYHTSPRSVMKTALMVSFFSHLIMILGIQALFPIYWTTGELKTYRVDLIRMEVDDIPSGAISDTFFDDTQKQEQPLSEETQDTISLDTKDKRYISYTSAIKRQIMKNWRYPPEARAYLLEGKSMVLFSLISGGEIGNITVTRTSGHEVLDNEIVRAIKRSVPFPPFPPSIKVKKLNINGTFEYRLTSSKDNR